jgi:hypothetical protein
LIGREIPNSEKSMKKKEDTMKRISTTFFALATLLLVASAAFGQSGCTNATIKGSYGINFTGSTNGLPLAVVGVLTNDGQGNISSTYTVSVNGEVTTGVHAVGTYSVNPDCTASATDTTDGLHYTFVILRHGAEMFVINTDSGNTFTGDFKKQ